MTRAAWEKSQTVIVRMKRRDHDGQMAWGKVGHSKAMGKHLGGWVGLKG